MKPLNRPMFKYGGPIKEGIMKGMKDGGSLSPQFNTGLVGDERYPKTGGREHHFAFLAPLAFNVARTALMPLGRLAMQKALRSGLTKGVGNTVRSGLGRSRTITPADMTGTKLTFNPNAVGKYFMASPEYKFATGAGGKASKFVGGALKGLKKSPLGIGLTAGTMTDILPGGRPFGPDKYLPNLLGNRYDEEGNKIPGTGLFNPDTVAAGEGEGLKRVEELGTGEKKVDPKVLKELNEDRIDRTKKRYYEIMGLDKMKKEAVYDSLINASQIISQEGGDLKGSIKSGSLQNQLINAISKNLDKSADIKRQVDAAILKGEITKDIASADTTDKRLKEARIKALDRAEKQSGASGVIAQIIAKDGTISGSQTGAVLRADGIDYDTVLQDKLFTDFQKDNPTKDEVDFLISKGTALPDGRYVVGARLVEKKGNEVAFIV
jgi:hypothetical protein